MCSSTSTSTKLHEMDICSWVSFFVPLFCFTCLVQLPEKLKQALEVRHGWMMSQTIHIVLPLPCGWWVALIIYFFAYLSRTPPFVKSALHWVQTCLFPSRQRKWTKKIFHRQKACWKPPLISLSAPVLKNEHLLILCYPLLLLNCSSQSESRCF